MTSRTHRPARLLLALGLLLRLSSGYADDTLNTVRFSSYGTFALTWDDRRDMSPIRDISQLPRDVAAPYAGFASEPSWRLDSRLGMQVDYRLNPYLEMVGQVVLRDHVAANLRNSMESAYLGLLPVQDLDVRLGRVGYDAFLMSDTRNLGYSYSWVRPPTEFYGWIPIFSVDGLDAAYRFGDDDTRWRVKVQAGRSAFNIPMGNGQYDFSTRNLRTLTLTRQSGAWRQKIGYSRFTIDRDAAPLSPLLSGLTQVFAATSGAFPAIAADAGNLREEMRFRGARVDYMTLGAAYDDGTWVAQAELGHTRASADIVPHGRMAYLAVGRRFGAWTPYLVASVIRPQNGLRSPATDWSAIGQSGLQAQALRVLNTTRMSQDTVTFGVRWDVHDQMALKLQLDSTRVGAYGYGLWFRDLDLVGRSSRVNLLTLGLDFAF